MDRLRLAVPGNMVEPVGGLLTVLLPGEAGLMGRSLRGCCVQLLQQLVRLPPGRQRGCVGAGAAAYAAWAVLLSASKISCRLSPAASPADTSAVVAKSRTRLLDVLPKR